MKYGIRQIFVGLMNFVHLVKRLRSKSQNVSVALLLSVSVAGCGTFAEVVEAPQPIVKLKYQNPMMPSPVLPINPTMDPLTLVLQNTKTGEVRKSEFICMTHNDSLDLLAWIKTNAAWQRRARAVVKFHEDQNQ